MQNGEDQNLKDVILLKLELHTTGSYGHLTNCCGAMQVTFLTLPDAGIGVNK